MSDTEDACDRLVAELGGTVVVLSVAGASPFRDLPDRRYRLRATVLWAELKSKTDRFYRGQLDFLRAEYEHGQIVFAGDEAMLRAMVLKIPGEWRRIGWENVAIIAARGFRKARRAA